jgi:Concanavalin A-like lectin/glucanases superfamily
MSAPNANSESGGFLNGISSSFSNPSNAGLSSNGSANGGGFGLKEFMESNSLVAKFAFILMVFIVFTVAVKLSIIAISYLMLPSMTPFVLDGTANTEDMVIEKSQDPSKKDSVLISRSMNEDGGLEYTWSSWFFINQVPIEKDKYSRIFSKGGQGTKSSDDGIYYPNNAPGLYIKFTDTITDTNPDRSDKGTNVTLLAVVDVVGKNDNQSDKKKNLNEQLIATDIPIKKWVNAVIRVTNNVIDLYINGRLAQRRKTAGIPIQNYGKVYIGESKSSKRFSGYISTIQYFNYSIGSNKIKSIVDEGPNMKMVSSSGGETSTKTVGSYLSNNWYMR